MSFLSFSLSIQIEQPEEGNKSNQIKSNQTKSNQIKSNQTSLAQCGRFGIWWIQSKFWTKQFISTMGAHSGQKTSVQRWCSVRALLDQADRPG